MSDAFSPGAPAQGGLRGILKSWLRTWSSELRHLSEELRVDAGRPSAHPCSSVRVLVVDDNPVNQMLMSALMESRGLVPVLAADGAEAVALACELHFDLILMDLQMPVLDGLTATAAIRHFENTHSRPAVPVLAYSGALPGAHVLAAHGMNGSLAKPCDAQELEDCLVQWCPAYRSVPSVRGVPVDNSRWQAANPNSRSSSAWLR